MFREEAEEASKKESQLFLVWTLFLARSFSSQMLPTACSPNKSQSFCFDDHYGLKITLLVPIFFSFRHGCLTFLQKRSTLSKVFPPDGSYK